MRLATGGQDGNELNRLENVGKKFSSSFLFSKINFVKSSYGGFAISLEIYLILLLEAMSVFEQGN